MKLLQDSKYEQNRSDRIGWKIARSDAKTSERTLPSVPIPKDRIRFGSSLQDSGPSILRSRSFFQLNTVHLNLLEEKVRRKSQPPSN